jgi:hypothetical protein
VLSLLAVESPYLPTKTILIRGFLVCLGLLVIARVIPSILQAVDDLGWIPHTKDVPVLVDTRSWIQEEVKACASVKAQNKELSTLICYDGDNGPDSGQSHILSVRFWGSIEADKDKLWKCTRGKEFVTCKLQ